jgi:hypothetical protein
MSTTWTEDYTNTFNSIQSMALGATTRGNVVLIAMLFTAFKRLIDYAIAQEPTVATGEPIANPFDLTK